MKPLTKRMIAVLWVLRAAGHSMTANEIAHKIGFHTGQDADRHSRNGRSMAPAQRVIFPLIGLCERKLVGRAMRRDGRSGGAFVILREGIEYCKK